MKHVLFRRILFSYIIKVPLLFISLEIYISQVIKDNHISKLKESLGIQAGLISDRIPRYFRDGLDDFCRHYKEKTGARVTIIASIALSHPRDTASIARPPEPEYR